MPYLPDLPVSARFARCDRANGRNAMSDGPRSTCGGLVRKLGGLSDILLAHHDDGVPNTVACIFSARAWLGEIDRAAEDGGAYLRGQHCLIHRDALAWSLETDDLAAPLRQYTASHRVPGNGNRASDSQLPVRRGVYGP